MGTLNDLPLPTLVRIFVESLREEGKSAYSGNEREIAHHFYSCADRIEAKCSQSAQIAQSDAPPKADQHETE